MIRTDGKPTIANNPYAAHRVRARNAVSPCPTCRLPRVTDKYPCGGCGHIDCPCARCSEYDPDAAPGGYDNPSDPIDWSPDE